MSILVRPATPDDVPALVRLRLANAERHIQLVPDMYRMPDPAAVRQHFEQTLAAGQPTVLISVAQTAGEVVGMSELVMHPVAPDHQMLLPRREADIHTVVLDSHRSRGIGAALVAAAERTAATHHIDVLYARISATNEGAHRFYSGAEYLPRGTILQKSLTPSSAAISRPDDPRC